MKTGTWTIKELYPGAHIRVKTNGYYHHGIYIGNNEVVQFGLPNDLSKSFDEIEVLKSPIEDFSNNLFSIEVYSYSKKELKQKFPDKIIVDNALSHVGERGYNILTNNCEHLANLCIFGSKKSNQIDDIYKNVEDMLNNNK